MDTMDVICQFLLNTREDFIFVIDQLNSLDHGNRDADHRGSAEVSQWLALCMAAKYYYVRRQITMRSYNDQLKRI